MPVALVGRDHAGEDVLVGPVLARAVVLRPTLLDANSANEGHAFELAEADCAGGTRLWRHVVGLEPERTVEDSLEDTAGDLGGLCLARCSAVEDPPLPELALR